MAKYLTPGVYINEYDLSFTPTPVGVSAPYTLVFISSKWGPVGEPVKIDTAADYWLKFGVPDYDPNDKFSLAWDAASKLIATGATKLIVYRLNTDATSAVFGDANYASTVLIKYPGSYGNYIAVEYNTATVMGKTVHNLIVYKVLTDDISSVDATTPITDDSMLSILESFSAETITDLIDKVNRRSNYIVLDGSFNPTSAFGPNRFDNGSDGNVSALNDTSVVNALSDDRFKAQTETPFEYVATLGVLGPTAVNALASLAAERKDFIIIADFDDPDLDVSGAITARNNYATGATGSYIALYYPWMWGVTLNGQKIKYPVSYYVAATLLAQTQSFGYPWVVVAGANRGVVSDEPVKVLVQKEKDQLYDNQINPVVKSGETVMIWGNKTLGRKGSALEFLHARRAVIYIEQQLAKFCNSFIFEIYTPTIRSAIESGVDRILAEVAANRGITGYKFDIDDTDLLESNGPLQINVAVAPMKDLEWIELNYIIQNNI